MGEKSQIEWTDATWNPIRGCTRVSEGCRNCYAERVAMRFSGAGQPYEGLVKISQGHPQWTGKVQFVEEHLEDPLRWKKPRRVFVNSMSDLFHEGLDFLQIGRIFEVMEKATWHTFQVLTKRPQRMCEFMRAEFSTGQPPANVWLGVSCEDQPTADKRVPFLLQTPAAVRWVSAEPLLGPIDLTAIRRTRAEGFMRPLDGRFHKVDWVVVGGESGPGARPMHPDWARSLRDQCQAAGVPLFFKQWGEYVPVSVPHPPLGTHTQIHYWPDDSQSVKVGKKAAGRLLDGREWNEYPEGRHNGK